MITVKKCANDNSPYVRKCAAHAVSKIWHMDQSEGQRESLSEIVEKLLNDSSTMVLGSAVEAMAEVCPDKLELLHRPYRKICHLLADIDEWGQISTMNTLMRYARDQFLDPCAEADNKLDREAPSDAPRRKRRKKRIKKAFYSDEEDEVRQYTHKKIT